MHRKRAHQMQALILCWISLENSIEQHRDDKIQVYLAIQYVVQLNSIASTREFPKKK